ncbi:MAG: hypothetical protein EZS28_015918 [Streblomastix strix]|uniref:Uncharacterized protein n=1 Tax=Streblomastix strix TaxID=222440 RepID=A0A5J4W107_9EUKA|nr:MAG: hypothetical protein EZS28_015918 [Streblomastix strix]
MQFDYQIQISANAIISFADSYAKNKKGKENEQPESEPTSSLTKICSTLRFLYGQIWNNNTSKYMIHIPKLLRSVVALSRFKVGIHLREDANQQSLKVRSSSRDCLSQIQHYGDAQIQTELVFNQEYGRMMSIVISTAGGKGEEQHKEILNGLMRICNFLRDLHEGRNYQPSFQPLPLLARRTEEQIEEEGANEEIDAQINNNGYYGNVIYLANLAKAVILNHFIHNN